MISIVYVSDALAPLSQSELTDLLDVSRRNNDARGLTGVLLYKDGQFMQALEGEPDAVRERLDVIAADPRHTGVRELLTEDIERRRFPNWSMGFRTAADLDGLEGFNDFFGARRGVADRAESGSRARLLLEWFRFRNV